MRELKDVPSHRLLVECSLCRRRGAYSLDRLKSRHGDTISLRALLALMRERCLQQPCQAQLCVPLQLDLDATTLEANHYDLEIWMADGSKEMTLGRVWHRDLADAAFDRAALLWPHSIMTMRNRWKLVRVHNAEEDARQERQARVLERFGFGRAKPPGGKA